MYADDIALTFKNKLKENLEIDSFLFNDCINIY